MEHNLVKLIIVLSITTALLCVAPSGEALHSLFQTFDRNEDGKIDHKEFSTEMTTYVFSKLDDNESTAITRTEWGVIDGVEDNAKHNELFSAMDRNNDKIISFGEFSDYAEKHSNIKDAFMKLDKDMDGFLMPSEIPSRPQFRMVTLRF
jgi:Ca2+-binding EF-hand superfamily protein